ncbi:MAG: nuclear transport factor 2 family protein [Thaumarchaeota archaeon]|nr:nuclear transport factor 2 family protein [Nitrososphaerota archaeon]MCL5317186.1 nuclear transport factor 2 family protein [Nitrososphaerota archaeon]
MSEKANNDDPSVIEEVVRRRIDGIKLKKPELIRESIDASLYSKFDDWPPGTRMEGEEALRGEDDAIKVLEEYSYKLDDFAVKVKGDFAWVSFYFGYNGTIRKKSFDIRSRVSMVLARSRSGSAWKIVHEHFSMFPSEMPVTGPRLLVKKDTEGVEKQLKDLDEAVLKALEDGSEKHIADLTKQVSKTLGRDIPASEVVNRCKILESKGEIRRSGRFYPRYIIVKK